MTEGMAARSCMVGLSTIAAHGGVHSHRKIAQANPKGIPSRRAPRVTQKEPKIMGRIPKDPWLGTHRSPRMKALGPIFQINGRPSPNMKIAIRARMEIEEKAINKSIFSMIFSLISTIILQKFMDESSLTLPFGVTPGPLGSRQILKRNLLLLQACL
jgi:hypothetical protein